MILKFGKHAGKPLGDVPREYLEWILEENSRTNVAISEELERRDAAEEANLPWIEKIVLAGYRDLAKKHHPDVGGDTEAMKEINRAADYLRALVRSL